MLAQLWSFTALARFFRAPLFTIEKQQESIDNKTDDNEDLLHFQITFVTAHHLPLYFQLAVAEYMCHLNGTFLQGALITDFNCS